ncbi:MAG: AMP-binding protein [Polaromonas sp.]|uniref:AMP-binding protein n=1 Tax=Polaromonas sp. TaxID=1869339 RepID=UPI0024887C73|nr:AMP-binding protein [Polaromonas sp.]MDI1239709.1 AMP-binding protein [Polaromonas sp.]
MTLAHLAPGDAGSQASRLGDLLVDAIARFPQRVALVDADASLSYEALGARIAHALAVFRALGLRQGEVVAQLCGNRIDMFCVMAAAYVGGYCSVTLHAMAGADDHAAILDDCGARMLVCESHYAQRAQLLRERCAGVSHWLSHDGDDAKVDFWRQASQAAGAVPQAQGAAEDIIRIGYTGGTTGRPKGAMLSNRSMLTNARLWLAGLDWPDGVRTLCSAPISHGAGSLIYPTLARGGTVVLQRGFTPQGWLDAVRTHRIQHTFIVPTMLYALLDHPATATGDLDSLCALMYGAAPASPSRIRQALKVFGPVLVQTYGQTEAPNTILLLDQQAHAQATDVQLASAGRPFPGLEVALHDDVGRPVPEGEVGEICVRGLLLMSGYRGQPEQTRAALRGGWLCTGDLARRDPQGLFFIVDRKKDMIISGGFNVYPKEVEDVLASHPDVAAVAVIGVPDARWGEAVKAVVVRRPGAQACAEDLMAYVRSRKGAIYTPKSVDFVDTVPVTGLGKADKKALRHHYQTRHEQGFA